MNIDPNKMSHLCYLVTTRNSEHANIHQKCLSITEAREEFASHPGAVSVSEQVLVFPDRKFRPITDQEKDVINNSSN